MSSPEYQYDTRGLIKVANQIKEHVLGALAKDGILTQEQYDKAMETYGIIIREPGMLGSAWGKVWGEADKGQARWDVVKSMGIFGRHDGKTDIKEEKMEDQKTRFEKI